MRLPKLLAVGLAAALALSVSAAPANATPADGAISVKIELGGPQDPASTYRVFERKNFVPGPGVDIGWYHETQNPEDYCGDVAVNVDPTKRRVTVGNALRPCNFGLVRVTIESDYIRNLRPISDDLFKEDTSIYDRNITSTARGVIVAWTDPTDWWYDTGGTAVFTWDPVTFGSATPKISGKKKVGKKLKVKGVTAASLTPKAAAVSYQWYRGKKRIKGATKASYKIKKADAGKKLHAKITARAYGITTKTYSSKKVKIKKIKRKKK